nr:Rho GTPase-activating protein REN1-like isoform X1 [Tanacetum cinerariifolium]
MYEERLLQVTGTSNYDKGDTTNTSLEQSKDRSPGKGTVLRRPILFALKDIDRTLFFWIKLLHMLNIMKDKRHLWQGPLSTSQLSTIHYSRCTSAILISYGTDMELVHHQAYCYVCERILPVKFI